MEQSKEKKSRDIGFDNVKDPLKKVEILELVKCPADATNFIFWYSKTQPNEWGLTLKSIPNKSETAGFPSQHTWKVTWGYKNDSEGERLAVANHCRSLASDVTGNNFTQLKQLFSLYRNKN